MIIAIDGPAASGKTTVARGLARALGLVFLDTGAMYRAVALAVLRRGVDPGDGEACARVAGALELGFDAQGRVLIDGLPGEPEVRSPQVDALVSAVSAHPGVRAAIVPIQRRLARAGAVAEGRDTGSVVFPAADHKFFLRASAAERARRRALQQGRPELEGEIRVGLERRDHLDSTRADSPLALAPGAEVIDTDGLDAEQVVALLLERVRAGSQP